MGEIEAQRIAVFQRLADERLDASYRLANAILGDVAQSEDAVHDAVVLAWQRWGSLRDRSKFDAWFARIVVNVCRNRLRSDAYRRATDITDAASTAPDVATDVHQRLLVEQALEQLKPDDIVVIALRHFLDLQLEDVALLLDIALPTAKTRLRSARLRLRAEIERQSPDEVA